ncbi:MAG: hypothetical protein M9955_04570 [Rhizobiaceae bacterium]|nr:hypothetical protein [Rhizobiaceae bacterium]
MSQKSFPTAAVLSVVTGSLLCDIGQVYEVLNFMTGESVYTHQLPRISREATPVLLARRPELQAAIDEADQVNPENWQAWLATWVERYGETMAVPRMTIGQHERIDPLSELAEKVHPSRIIVVQGRGNG